MNLLVRDNGDIQTLASSLFRCMAPFKLARKVRQKETRENRGENGQKKIQLKGLDFQLILRSFEDIAI